MGTSIIAELQNDWAALLKEEQEKDYYLELLQHLEEQYRNRAIFPAQPNLYRALQLTSFEEVKVVILGQDPYHGPNQAHGLSFSVMPGIKQPPSLKNIFKELKEDIGCKIPSHGFLEHWAKQGVLLLNNVLTVQEGLPNSHRKLGWETFTDRIIALLSARERPVAFVLWGKPAQQKGRYIDSTRHLVLKSVHPSPLSAYGGFWGSKPFSLCNAFLEEQGLCGIDWEIPEVVDK